MTERDEIDAINGVLDGDIDAFSDLVDAYQNPLIRMIAAILNDERRLAEDVAQEVFVQAFKRLADYDPARSKFGSWLFMIGRRRAINALKKRRPTLMAEPPDLPDPTPEMTGARDELKLLDAALHELPPKQKRAFSLAVIETLPYSEIAQIEGVSVGTIKSRVSRAREYLQTTLSEFRR